MTKEGARRLKLLQFFNRTPTAIRVVDAGGAVMLGPFLPGTEELGPWYSIDELTDRRFEMWQRMGLIS